MSRICLPSSYSSASLVVVLGRQEQVLSEVSILIMLYEIIQTKRRALDELNFRDPSEHNS